jgi:3-phenylpropionate/cinnamic acid dioxygenase small subunit
MIDQHEARLGIERTHILYTHLIDDLRMREWGDLFCTDATWSAFGTTFVGRANIVTGVTAMEPERPGMVRHVTYPAVLEFDGEQVHSWANAMALVVKEDGATIVSVGRYYDVMRKREGRWRFFSRTYVQSGHPLPAGVRPCPGN